MQASGFKPRPDIASKVPTGGTNLGRVLAKAVAVHYGSGKSNGCAMYKAMHNA